ncbi:MAG: hypothetical protein ABIJ97_03165 [Bacteroidota bacterium]
MENSKEKLHKLRLIDAAIIILKNEIHLFGEKYHIQKKIKDLMEYRESIENDILETLGKKDGRRGDNRYRKYPTL